jgi:hypothetical protein
MGAGNYREFLKELISAGFSTAMGNDYGVFSVIDCSWSGEIPEGSAIRWHSGDKDHDPWEWRIRVLQEETGISYSKCFFNKSGYITKEWFPYFLRARRGDARLIDEYREGKISSIAKNAYDAISNGPLPAHMAKRESGAAKEGKSRFEAALVELQMKFYITISGYGQKVNKLGIPYGWECAEYATTEHFWGDEPFGLASLISKEEACEKIHKRVLELNPSADRGKINKFIGG